MLWHPRRALTLADNTPQPSGIGWGVKGLLSNVLNPKIGIFYVSFLPQFIPPQQSFVGWTLMLVTMHVAIGLTWFMLLISATRPLSQVLRRVRVVKWLDRITGGVLLFFAGHLAFSRH